MKTAAFALLSVTLFPLSGCNWIELVTVSTTGEQANDTSYLGSISDDGRYVVFSSDADNLVAGDTNNIPDVFVRDTASSITTRVSVDSAGMESNGDSWYPSLSGNGRYVAFESEASNLVTGDTNNAGDVFLHDMVTSDTTRVSVDSDGMEANAGSGSPATSADGRYVAFASSATNLVSGDTNDATDVFLHDNVTGSTTRISVDSAGMEANDGSGGPAISADGLYVAFQSAATNLVAGDTNNAEDIFLYDRMTGTTTLVSVSSTGMPSNHTSGGVSLSTDGRYVAFYSRATNLVPEGSDDWEDVYVHDRVTGTTIKAGVDSAGEELGLFGSGSWGFSISGNGRYVAFSAFVPSIVMGETLFRDEVLVRDMTAGITTRVSVDSSGTISNGGSRWPIVSGDGRYVAFESFADNLVPNDTNGNPDIVIRAIHEVSVSSVTPDLLPTGKTTTVTITGVNFLPGATPFIDGAEFSNVVIADDNTITADVAVPSGAMEGLRDVRVGVPGTGPGTLSGALGTCADCVTFTAVNCGCGCP